MDGLRPPTGQAAFRQGKVRQQPRTFLPQGLRDARNDFLQLLGGKAVQEEIRDHKVESFRFGMPLREGVVEELHACRRPARYRATGNLQHGGTRIDADKAGVRKCCQRRRQKASMAFPEQGRAVGRAHRVEPGSAGALKGAARQDSFHPPVVAGEPVKTHPNAMGSKSNRFHHSPETTPPAVYAKTSNTSPVTGNTRGPTTSKRIDQTTRWEAISAQVGGRS